MTGSVDLNVDRVEAWADRRVAGDVRREALKGGRVSPTAERITVPMRGATVELVAKRATPGEAAALGLLPADDVVARHIAVQQRYRQSLQTGQQPLVVQEPERVLTDRMRIDGRHPAGGELVERPPTRGSSSNRSPRLQTACATEPTRRHSRADHLSKHPWLTSVEVLRWSVGVARGSDRRRWT